MSRGFLFLSLSPVALLRKVLGLLYGGLITPSLKKAFLAKRSTPMIPDSKDA